MGILAETIYLNLMELGCIDSINSFHQYIPSNNGTNSDVRISLQEYVDWPGDFNDACG